MQPVLQITMFARLFVMSDTRTTLLPREVSLLGHRPLEPDPFQTGLVITPLMVEVVFPES